MLYCFILKIECLEHLQGILQMNFASGVICKVLNSFAKSKNSSTPRDFAFRLGKPKVWTSPLNFFSPIAPARFFPSRHFGVRRACQSPPVAAQPRSSRQSPPSPGRVRRSRQFGSVHLRPPPREGPREGRSTSVPAPWHAQQLEGGRAWQGGRTGVEKSRGVGGDGVRRGRPKL